MTDPAIQIVDAKSSGPSLLACLLCRQKHLKCDGATPVCGRCASAGASCQYTPSRRGYKGQSKKRRFSQSSPEQGAADPAFDDISTSGIPIDPTGDSELPVSGYSQSSTVRPSSSSLWDSSTVFNTSDSNSNSNSNNSTTISSNQNSNSNDGNSIGVSPLLQSVGPPTPTSLSALANDGYLIDIYYDFFHPSHPLLPPLHFLHNSPIPFHLEQVLKFVGAHYTPTASSEVYRPSVVVSVVNQPPSVEQVQELVVLAIVLHSRNERGEAGECLAKAVDLALELGLHRRDYATTMGKGDPVREESLRRTWWELFFVEGILTALGLRPTSVTNSVAAETPLPCEESIYQRGLPSPWLSTVAEFDERVFSDEEQVFSSYSYRVEAMRILQQVVAIQHMVQGQKDQVEAVVARIASYFHHLPESKAELIGPDGTVDEMMFQVLLTRNNSSLEQC